MSYFAEGMMKQKGLDPNTGGPLAPPQEPYTPPPRQETPLAPAAAPAVAADPRSFTYDAPPGAEDPSTPVGKERARFATAGVSQNEAYRLLGGPRQKLGA
jgi:hypothetical protein